MQRPQVVAGLICSPQRRSPPAPTRTRRHTIAATAKGCQVIHRMRLNVVVPQHRGAIAAAIECRHRIPFASNGHGSLKPAGAVTGHNSSIGSSHQGLRGRGLQPNLPLPPALRGGRRPRIISCPWMARKGFQRLTVSAMTWRAARGRRPGRPKAAISGSTRHNGSSGRHTRDSCD